MDTTLMEYTAEDLIAHKLQKAGLLISKPKFDRDGTDLIALMEVKDGASFCRIQCKGRSLVTTKSSSVKIPKKYVTGAFVTFLYVDDGNSNNTYLFTFFVDEIIKWSLNSKDEYVLNFYENSFREIFLENSFSDICIDRIKKTISEANVKAEIKIVIPSASVGFATGEIQGNKYIYQNSTKEALVKQVQGNLYQTTIKDKSSGIERVGSNCPGNPKDYEYNLYTDSWRAK